MRHYAEHEGKDVLTCIPRGHCKTLFKCARNIQRISRNKNIAIMTLSATDVLSKGIGIQIGDELRRNDILQACFLHLPRPGEPCKQWGAYALSLNDRGTQRIDPTLRLASIGSNITGAHPDIIDIDDVTVEQNNNPAGYEKVEMFLANCMRLLPTDGFFDWAGTRWSDSDPLGKAIDGIIKGRQGPFHSMVLSCFEDDDPEKDIIYPYKYRWNETDKKSGYKKEDYLRDMSDESPRKRSFFNCQMRNDPMPLTEQRFDLEAIRLYDPSNPEEYPKFQPASLVGVEATGGGLVVANLLQERLDSRGIIMPLQTITMPSIRHVEKADRIHATLEPIINEGRLNIPYEEMPKDPKQTECLGYELTRLGVAKHDDMADCLHFIPEYLAKGIYPREEEDAHLYIACDPAYSESLRSDWSVLMAVAVDKNKNYWLLGKERFKENRPTVICDRIIQFYIHWNARAIGQGVSRRRKKSFAARYK